ncbi:MAG: HAD family hydrolase [Terriglobales bacterium]
MGITTLFWDLGGVVLTNGWGHSSRRVAADTFGLDAADFEERHHAVFPAWEAGESTLDLYLERTVFYRARSFSKSEFADFMYQQSQPLPGGLELLSSLSSTYRCVMLNNEPREINQYRLDRFQLRPHFAVFCCSCFVRLRKPDPRIYALALNLVQRSPEECLFLDDRSVNLEGAAALGIQTLQAKDPAQLRRDLQTRGIQSADVPLAV